MKKYIKGIIIALALVSILPCTIACKGDKSQSSGQPWIWGKKDGGSKDNGSEGEIHYPKASGSFRIMSYNVGNLGKYITSVTDNANMVAAMVKEAGADAVALNELDSVNTRHNVNEALLLAGAVGGWQWHFGRAMAYRGGAYGNGVIVPGSVKIVDKYTVALPKEGGAEQRSIAVIETDKYVIGAAHLDHTSAQAQLAQVAVVNAWATGRYSNSTKPVFFCGDMNAQPGSGTVAALKDSWNMLSSTEPSYPSRTPDKCIDYIFHFKNSASVKLVGAHSMTKFHGGDVTMASDHLPIYADVQF